MVIAVDRGEEGPHELVGALRRGPCVETVQARRHRGSVCCHHPAPFIR
jgi:hypothetical protein